MAILKGGSIVNGTLSVETLKATKIEGYVDVTGKVESATSLVWADSAGGTAGGTNQPVYFAGGIPVKCEYQLNTTVPPDAIFKYSAGAGITINNSTISLDAPVPGSETASYERPIILGGSDSSTDISNKFYYAAKSGYSITANPSNGEIKANIFSLNGNSAVINIGAGKITGNKNISINGQDGKIEATSFNAKSDARLKENFQPLNLENSILDLPTYKFDFIDGAKNQIGCKAQDLQEICPEIVNEGTDGMLSIQESKIIYLLLEEVKKLRKELDELRGR